MIKLYTGKYFNEMAGHTINHIDRDFNSIKSKLKEIPADEVSNIIMEIDGVKGTAITVESKFDTTGTQYPLDILSSGCKTALVIAYYKTLSSRGLLDKTTYINITECGPKALDVCLRLLEATNGKVCGVMINLLSTSKNFKEMNIRLNDTVIKNWMQVRRYIIKEISNENCI